MMNLSRKRNNTHNELLHFPFSSWWQPWQKMNKTFPIFFVSSNIKCLSLFCLLSLSLCFFWFTTERFVARKLRCEYCSINFLTLKMSNFYGIVTLNDKLTWQKKKNEKQSSEKGKKKRKTNMLVVPF